LIILSYDSSLWLLRRLSRRELFLARPSEDEERE
jgi:hypothetical protein